MNRNVNVTGNYGGVQGKNLKPGDSALIGMKSGTQNFKMNTISNDTNSNKISKYDNLQLNEAKESMKLLQLKMGSNLASNNMGGSLKNIANDNKNFNNLNNHISNNNYRKPFKPSFENENMGIQVDSYKNFPGTSTGMNKINSKNQFGSNGVSAGGYKNTANRISNTSGTQRNYQESTSKQMPNSMQKNKNNFKYEEVEDDRPAQAKTEVRFDRVEQNDEDEEGDRYPCPTCDRKFREEALVKHQKVCKKVFASKRKAFDIKKKRLDGEAAAILKYKEIEEKKKGKFGNNNNINNKAKGAKWKKQSEEFRAILRANRTTTSMPSYNTNSKYNAGGKNTMKSKPGTSYNNKMDRGKNILPVTMPTTSVLYEDYIQCNHCNRKYNEQAYNKHLPTCERKAKEVMLKDKMKSGGGSISNNKPNLNVRFGKR